MRERPTEITLKCWQLYLGSEIMGFPSLCLLMWLYNFLIKLIKRVSLRADNLDSSYCSLTVWPWTSFIAWHWLPQELKDVLSAPLTRLLPIGSPAPRLSTLLPILPCFPFPGETSLTQSTPRSHEWYPFIVWFLFYPVVAHLWLHPLGTSVLALTTDDNFRETIDE